MSIETDSNGDPLSLPFDPEQTAYVRMRPSALARLFGVTPGAVSHWLRAGKITKFADGTICPATAARQLAKNCDLNRLRAKPFRPLRDELEQMRTQARLIKHERDDLAARLEASAAEVANLAERLAAALRLAGEHVRWLSLFADAVEALEPDEVTAATGEDWPALVAALFDDAGAAAMAIDDAEAVGIALDELAAGMPADTLAPDGGDPGSRRRSRQGGAGSASPHSLRKT